MSYHHSHHHRRSQSVYPRPRTSWPRISRPKTSSTYRTPHPQHWPGENWPRSMEGWETLNNHPQHWVGENWPRSTEGEALNNHPHHWLGKNWPRSVEDWEALNESCHELWKAWKRLERYAEMGALPWDVREMDYYSSYIYARWILIIECANDALNHGEGLFERALCQKAVYGLPWWPV